MLPARNLLSEETSPYLLQHADNPVNWRCWNEAALQEARETGKPILLSIGYAACHWCHVMAHESFEDTETAALMNRLYVNIKVDREERPDLDQIFMAALTATGVQGGWPLTMFLTPEGRPFWGGTYFPPTPRYGQPAFRQVLQAVEQTWREKAGELEESSERLAQHLRSSLSPSSSTSALSIEPFTELSSSIVEMMDMAEGGLTGAPKFPNAPFVNAVWLRWTLQGDSRARDAVLLSLRKMLCGGIYDHVGGGLARYSTDARWIVPHFEKMLYDNAQLIRLSNWAFGETRDPFFEQAVAGTIDWLTRDMTLPSGGFASSLDADSEGGEGAFYTWTVGEIDAALGADSAHFLAVYELASPAHWEGKPILVRRHADADDGAKEMLERLKAFREGRPHPARDDKVLADWNGLAITALAEASRLFGRTDWFDAADNAFRFVYESTDQGRLPHNVSAGARQSFGLSSDYASLILASTALYQASWNETYLLKGRQLFESLKSWHPDEQESGFYLTASDAPDVPFHIRGDIDEATPSATAQILDAIARLSLLTGDPELHAFTLKTAEAAQSRAMKQRYGQVGTLTACASIISPLKLVIADEASSGELVAEANRSPDYRRVDRLANAKSAAKLLPGDMPVREGGQPAAYLCEAATCFPPVFDSTELSRLLARRGA